MNRESLRRMLVNRTHGCDVQHDGWPCNTCFHRLSLGVSPERLHQLWKSVLAYRGDYPSSFDFGQTPDEIRANIKELWDLLKLDADLESVARSPSSLGTDDPLSAG
jgi:hypothetical protein